MKLADFITRVRLDYNDLDGDRVEDPIIIDYLNEGVNELFKLSPGKFIKTVVAKLDESDLQQPCCCDLLYSVDAITDGHGNYIDSFKEIDDSAATAFGKRNCSRKGQGRSYSRVNNTDNQFTVKPPVTPNENIYARMTCAVKPRKVGQGSEQLDNAIIENYALLVDYVLYRLFGTETESVTSQNNSATHYKHFIDAIFIEQDARTAFINKNTYLSKGKKN